MVVSADVRRNAAIVVAVGAGFFFLQVLLAGLDRPLDADETAAWGWLRGVPHWAVRLGLMAITSAGLIVAFRTWVRPAGRISWTAAAAFAASWPALGLASQLDSSTAVALACVAAAGCALRWVLERHFNGLVGLTSAVAVAALFRPAAGLGLAAGLLVVIAVGARSAAVPGLGTVAAGLVVGTVPRWLVPFDPVGGSAGTTSGAGLREYLSLADGPLRAAATADLSVPAVVWIVALVVLAATGIVQRRWPHRRSAALTAVTVSAALVTSVLVGADAADVRLLLPAYALLLVAVSAGILHVWHWSRRLGSPVATGAVAVATVIAVVWQFSLVDHALIGA